MWNIKLRFCLRTRLKFYNEELPCSNAFESRDIYGTGCTGIQRKEIFQKP